MEYALQKLQALANGLSLSIHKLRALTDGVDLSIHNPILIYSFLALYGIMMLMLVAYVHVKFRTAAKALKRLQTDWQSAASTHADFVGVARESLSKLSSATTSAVAAPVARSAGIAGDLRNQIVAMSKRGSGIQDIARTCGLQECEVDVILGMARLQR